MGCAMGYAMAAVPRSIERHSTLCYGLTYMRAMRGWGVGVAQAFYRPLYCAPTCAHMRRSIDS